MPDWCFNRVTFTGTTDEINNIIEFVAGDTCQEPFSLNSIIPMLEESHENWYDWSVVPVNVTLLKHQSGIFFFLTVKQV